MASASRSTSEVGSELAENARDASTYGDGDGERILSEDRQRYKTSVRTKASAYVSSLLNSAAGAISRIGGDCYSVSFDKHL